MSRCPVSIICMYLNRNDSRVFWNYGRSFWHSLTLYAKLLSGHVKLFWVTEELMLNAHRKVNSLHLSGERILLHWLSAVQMWWIFEDLSQLSYFEEKSWNIQVCLTTPEIRYSCNGFSFDSINRSRQWSIWFQKEKIERMQHWEGYFRFQESSLNIWPLMFKIARERQRVFKKSLGVQCNISLTVDIDRTTT